MFDYNNLPKGLEININMRCIEMNTVTVMLEAISIININMRCIEI